MKLNKKIYNYIIMKVKGKRILKNGVIAGYVYYKNDKKWKWRFLKGPKKRNKQKGGGKVTNANILKELKECLSNKELIFKNNIKNTYPLTNEDIIQITLETLENKYETDSNTKNRIKHLLQNIKGNDDNGGGRKGNNKQNMFSNEKIMSLTKVNTISAGGSKQINIVENSEGKQYAKYVIKLHDLDISNQKRIINEIECLKLLKK